MLRRMTPRAGSASRKWPACSPGFAFPCLAACLVRVRVRVRVRVIVRVRVRVRLRV